MTKLWRKSTSALRLERRAGEIIDYRAAADAILVEEYRSAADEQRARIFEHAIDREILLPPPLIVPVAVAARRVFQRRHRATGPAERAVTVTVPVPRRTPLVCVRFANVWFALKRTVPS